MAYLFYNNHPVFEFQIETAGAYSILVIEDMYDPLLPTVTVTNDTDYVIEEISRKIDTIPPMVIYRDSEGRWDRIIIERNKFIAFAPIVPGLNKKIIDRQEAIELAILNYPWEKN